MRVVAGVKAPTCLPSIFWVNRLVRVRPWLLPVLLAALLASLGRPRALQAEPLSCAGDRREAARPLRVGVVPQLPPAELYARWWPLLERVGRAARLCFVLEIPRSIPRFEADLAAERFDLAFMNPFHQVMERAHYVPVLRDGRDRLSGILVTRRTGGVADLQALRQRPVAFPAPNAFAASLLIRAALDERRIPIQPVFVGTHSNVYRAVALGDVAAGGGVNNTLLRERPELQRSLRVLLETPGYAGHPLAALRRVPEPVRRRLLLAFQLQRQSPEGRQLLQRVQLPDPVAASYARDYAPIQRLGLERFVEPARGS